MKKSVVRVLIAVVIIGTIIGVSKIVIASDNIEVSNNKIANKKVEVKKDKVKKVDEEVIEEEVGIELPKEVHQEEESKPQIEVVTETVETANTVEKAGETEGIIDTPEKEENVVPVESQGNQQIIDAILREVNAIRQAKGNTPLTGNSILMQGADVRSKEIALSFSHTRPNGTSCFTVMDEIGYNYLTTGENIAQNWKIDNFDSLGVQIFTQWKNSQGHYENMINGDFKEIGIGIYIDDSGKVYAVQLFGSSR